MLTSLGLSCVVLSPCPRRPYSPRPQLYSSPLEVMAALCELPQAMSRMRFVFSASISRGLSQFLHTHTHVSSFNIITPTHTHFETGYFVEHMTGTYILLKCPSLPSSPSPHENTFPSTVKAMAWRPPVRGNLIKNNHFQTPSPHRAV